MKNKLYPFAATTVGMTAAIFMTAELSNGHTPFGFVLYYAGVGTEVNPCAAGVGGEVRVSVCLHV